MNHNRIQRRAFPQEEAHQHPEYPLDEPPKGYGLGRLTHQGDVARVSANPLPTRIILGTRGTDTESLAMSKRLLLQATPTEGGMQWTLADPLRPEVTYQLPQGQIYPVGRQNFDLFPGDERHTRKHVSREHLAMTARGYEVEIVQQGNTNNSYIMAPEETFQVTPSPDDAGKIQLETYPH